MRSTRISERTISGTTYNVLSLHVGGGTSRLPAHQSNINRKTEVVVYTTITRLMLIWMGFKGQE